MARIRTIKPEFCQSEAIGRLSRDARLLFIQLWTFVDDHGRCRGNSRLLAANLYPYDDDAPDLIDTWLVELEDNGCVRRYSADGNTYLDIPNWGKHQRIDNAGKSHIPEFRRELPRTADGDGDPPLDLGPRTIGPSTISVANATSVNIAIGPIAFESFWKTYPKREGSNPKEPARKRFMAIIKAGADPDAVIASARAYANEMRENKQFGTPYVAQAITWLNQQRWKDYTPAPDDPDKPRDDEVLAKHGYQWDETQGKVVKIEAA